MFVLNTSEHSGRILSNDSIGGYPNFDQILMKPICPKGYDKDVALCSIKNEKSSQQNSIITPETCPIKAYSISGTAVNMICNILDKDRLFDDVRDQQSDYLNFFGSDSFTVYGRSLDKDWYYPSISRSFRVRIGTLESLEAGAIIGKNIKANLIFSSTVTCGSYLENYVTQYSHNLKTELEFGLLRKNGSIQKIGTIPLINETNKTFPLNKTFDERHLNWNFFIEESFEGVMANQGDKIVIDVKGDISISSTPKPGASGSASVSYSFGIGFGRNYSPKQFMGKGDTFTADSSPRPIQISID